MIRISVDTDMARNGRKIPAVIVRAIDSDVRYAQGAHVADGAFWFSSTMGPIPGYPARVPSANRVRTVSSVTLQANALRAISSPTLEGTPGNRLFCTTMDCGHEFGIVGATYNSVEIDLHTDIRTRVIPTSGESTYRGIRNVGTVGDCVYRLSTVRSDLRDAILSDCFIRSYIDTALWSSTMMPEDAEVSDLSYERANFDASDCSLETVIGAKRDCDGFRESNDADLDASGDDDGRNGHNFWLSRNGHGAGFFDRCDAIGTRLQDASRVYGEVNLYHVGNVDDCDAIVYSDDDVDTIGGFDLATVWS